MCNYLLQRYRWIHSSLYQKYSYASKNNLCNILLIIVDTITYVNEHIIFITLMVYVLRLEFV